MAKVYNCSECDYCYTNETMRSEYICVNGKSDMFGKLVDWLGLAEDDMDCVVVNGKDRDELAEEDMESEQNLCDTNPFNDSRFGG